MDNPHFTIAIATHRRPKSLKELLVDLCSQEGDIDLAQYEVLVCENGSEESARGVMADLDFQGFSRVEYFRVKEKSLCLTRNKLLEEARGKALIFLDDDQGLPATFFVALESFWAKWGEKITGAKFKVTAVYESQKPTWIRRGNFFQWPVPAEGQPLTGLSTNGCIFKLAEMKSRGLVFDPAFVWGLTGGEDMDLFLRAKAQGALVISADTVQVFEKIPCQRESAGYILKRDFHRAMTYGLFLRRGDFGGTALANFLTTLVRFGVSLVVIPFSIFGGRVLILKCLTLFARQCGKLMGFFGFVSGY